MRFTLAVDPASQNYATVKFWGSDAGNGMLLFFSGGKQIGYRHLGDMDYLDKDLGEPAFLNRFFYTTTPLPLELTSGKTNLELEIRSYGQVWTCAQNFQTYQKPMTEPSCGIYKVYTHTDGFFSPPDDERQGAPLKNPPAAQSPGPEVLEQIKARVNREPEARLNSKTPSSQMQLQLLARAYDVNWTQAFHNPQAIEQILRGLDSLFAAYRRNPQLAQAESPTWNPGWFGLGVCGEVIWLRQAELRESLDKEIDDGLGGKMARRAAYAEMLVAGADEQTATTFGAQSTFILPVQGKGDAFIFMADRWNPANAIDGRYVWLPVDFRHGVPAIAWHDEWDLGVFDKQTTL